MNAYAGTACLAGVLALAALGECQEAGEVPTAELLRRLTLDDFEAREQATQALSARAEEAWAGLWALARGADLEAATRARQAMSQAVLRQLPAWKERAEKEVQALQVAKKEWEEQRKKKLNRFLRTDAVVDLEESLAQAEQEKERLAATQELATVPELRKKMEDLGARIKELAGKLQQAEQNAEEGYRARYNKMVAGEVKIEGSPAGRLAAQELGLLLAAPRLRVEDSPEFPKEWRPGLVRIVHPLPNLVRQISFEFNNTPLEECMWFLTSMLKGQIVYEESCQTQEFKNATVNMKVTDMNIGLALGLVLQAASAEYRLDEKDGALHIFKSKL